MKHATVGEKSILLGDAAAQLLLEYATIVARQRSAETVTLHAYDMAGTPTVVVFLLNEGVTILVEDVASSMTEPANDRAEDYLRARIDEAVRWESVSPEEIAGQHIWNADR